MPSREFHEDFAWQRHFAPPVQAILRSHLQSLRTATFHEDTRQATDFVLWQAKPGPLTIACRVRRLWYWHRYGGDLTLRSYRPARRGRVFETELAKIRHGYGDYMFYGFGWGCELNPNERAILEAWFLCDLDVFRKVDADGAIWTEKENEDGTRFIVVNPLAMPEGFVVAHQLYVPDTTDGLAAWRQAVAQQSG